MLFQNLLTVGFLLIIYNLAHYMQDQLVFIRHGGLFGEIDKSKYDLPIKEITYEGHDGAKLYAWYVPHTDPLGVFVFFHGNFRTISMWMKFAKRYHDWGYSVFMVEYRGYGKCPGIPTESDLYKDALSAYKYVNEVLKYSSDKIILNGKSLGGAIVINLAAKVPSAAIIVDSSFTNLSEVMNRVVPYIGRYICNYSFNSIDDIKKNKANLLIIHSRDDKLIPFKMGEKLLYNAETNKKQLLESKGGHNNYVWDNELISDIKQFCLESVNIKNM